MIDLKKEIMEQNRHLVVYGYNNSEREKFVKEMVLKYPFKTNSDKTIGIYLDNLGLPKLEKIEFEIDTIAINAFKRDYFSNLVSIEILNNILEMEDKSELKQDNFFKFINHFVNPNIKVNNLSDLKENLEISNNIYYGNYMNYIKNGSLHNFYEELPVTFFDLGNLIKKYKQLLSLNSYFSLVLDCKEEIDTLNQMVINTFIGARINGDLSVKLVCEHESFNCSCDLNGNYVQSVHDYGTIELDDSFKKLVKQNKITW